jgi:DNA-binding transcriptional LysR family regulator
MNLIYFQEFVVLSKYLNFHKAAETLNISQSALSKHIKQLEVFYRTKLFIRDSRHIELTPEGSALLNYAQQLTDIFNQSQSYIQNIKSSRPLIISGIVENPEDHVFIARLIQSSQLQGVNRHIRIKHAGNLYLEDQIASLKKGLIDCFIAYNLIDAAQDIEINHSVVFQPLCQVKLDAAVRSDGFLAQQEKLTLNDLSGAVFIHLAGANFTPTWNAIERLLGERGVPYQVRTLPADSIYDYMNVELGNEVLLLPHNRSDTWDINPYISIVPVADHDFTLSLEAATLKENLDEEFAIFLNELRKAYEKNYSACPVFDLIE